MCVDLFKSVQRLRDHDQIGLLLLNDDLEPNVHYQKLTNWRSREYSSVCIGSLASVRWHRGEFEKPRNGTPFGTPIWPESNTLPKDVLFTDVSVEVAN